MTSVMPDNDCCEVTKCMTCVMPDNDCCEVSKCIISVMPDNDCCEGSRCSRCSSTEPSGDLIFHSGYSSRTV